jgi:hypothetical protein
VLAVPTVLDTWPVPAKRRKKISPRWSTWLLLADFQSTVSSLCFHVWPGLRRAITSKTACVEKSENILGKTCRFWKADLSI